MALVTMNNPEIRGGVQHLENIVITNQAANSTAVTKAVSVPQWATKVVFYIFYDSATGTTPLFDFTLGMPDWGSRALQGEPTDATDMTTLIGDQAWDGITQVTGAGPYVIIVEVGPDVTADDVGSAAGNCHYGIKLELPPVLQYTYTTDGTTHDEDYAFRIAAHWKA